MDQLAMALALWLQATPWGEGVRTSIYAYPFVQATHFTGLSLWVGTNVALDLRLMGFAKNYCSAAELRDGLFAWNWAGFAVAITGGFLLFSSTAARYIVNPAFLVKLGILIPTALILHIFVQRKARRWEQAETPLLAKLMGTVELLLWIAVVTAAVLIPNYG